ncbi:MAG TPA: zf-HC2 domain-containing protein [Gemmatimonadales bacterium]|nr:zf-HC2 domain-containing protein [Gemmatimonadales bacterium]
MSTEPVNCDETVALLHDFLKRELTPESARAIRRHLDACRHCAQHAELERRFLELLERSGRRTRCPDALRARILDALRELGGAPE